MTVICEKGEYKSLPAQVASATKAMAFGNIIFGGLIGVAVDASTGAAYDYPAAISINMICTGDPTTIEQPSPIPVVAPGTTTTPKM